MKPETLELLACPACKGELTLTGDPTASARAASLHCVACARHYPVVNGIPHFIQPQELTSFNRKFARMYDWFSWVYRPFSAIAFRIIGMSEKGGRREILDRLEPQGGKVLEISIGPGVNLPFLLERPDVRAVYGLDISIGQLRRCQSYLRRKHWSVDLLLGNAEQLPVRDAAFESVFHIGGINFFNDKQKAIREMIRVAKPGARILISDENEKGARGYERTLPGFKGAFEGQRETITAPQDLVSPEMEDVRLYDLWKGWFYCLEFRKP
jgi:ubiquinone/menaquinone biosynthesis C-methylase UbiE